MVCYLGMRIVCWQQRHHHPETNSFKLRVYYACTFDTFERWSGCRETTERERQWIVRNTAASTTNSEHVKVELPWPDPTNIVSISISISISVVVVVAVDNVSDQWKRHTNTKQLHRNSFSENLQKHTLDTHSSIHHVYRYKVHFSMLSHCCQLTTNIASIWTCEFRCGTPSSFMAPFFVNYPKNKIYSNWCESGATKIANYILRSTL